MNSRDLSQEVVTALVDAGVDRIFGMPGGGNNLNLIAAARSAGISFILAHQETAATMMASVYGDLQSTPGVCVVTRGPGAASAVNGAANAQLDRQALLLVTDAVSEADAERIAHQRIDQQAVFAPVTKWNGTAGGHGDPATTTAGALHAASDYPRGAVHLDFDPAAVSTPAPRLRSNQSGAREMQQALRLLARAERPVFLLGVGARDMVESVREALKHTHAPVLSTYRAKGVVPDSWENNAGLLTGATTEAPVLEAADLIVLIGMDSVELIPGDWPYTAPVVSFAAWQDTSPYLVPAVEVVGNLPRLLEQITGAIPQTDWEPGQGNAHRDAEIERFRDAGVIDGALTPQQIVETTRALAPAGTIATIDAGAHMFPATVLWPVEHPEEMLISSGIATMGFALPAAIAAGLARPDRKVVCFTGDGGLGMCIGELETLARLDLDVTVIVFNDATLSLIDIKALPGDDPEKRAVKFIHSDFAKIAEGYGLRSHAATSAAELHAAVEVSLAHRGPTLIDASVDPRGYPEIMHAIRGQRQPA